MLSFDGAPAPDGLAGTRARNEATWSRYLEAYVGLRFAEAVEQFDAGGRVVFAEPIAGMPSAVAGRMNLLATWSSFGAAVQAMRYDGLRFDQTDDPDVATVEYRLRVRLRRGGTHDNLVRARVTFAGDRIAELVEGYDTGAQERLIAAVHAAARLV